MPPFGETIVTGQRLWHKALIDLELPAPDAQRLFRDAQVLRDLGDRLLAQPQQLERFTTELR